MHNEFKVPDKQWRQWPELAKRVFNMTYSQLFNNKFIMNHPRAAISDEHWETACWNAAWVAADAVDTSQRQLNIKLE